MRNLLSLVFSTRRRHAACDNLGISLRVWAYAAAYEREPKRGREKHVIQEGSRSHVLYLTERDGMRCSEPGCEINHSVPLSRGSLAWACGDLTPMEAI